MKPDSLHCSRRDVLIMALTTAAAYALPGTGQARPLADRTGDAQLATMLDDFAGEILVLSPEQATGLGVDTGLRSALKSQLSEMSPASDARWASLAKTMIARLDTLDVTKLGPTAKIRYDTMRHAAKAGIEGLRFSYGGAMDGVSGSAMPFPVTQQAGAIFQIPEFLATQHQIVDAADAEAYLDRVAALARLLDQETTRIAEQAGKGIAPSNFIARSALKQLADYRSTPAGSQKLVTAIAERTKQENIAGDWQTRATRLVDTMVYPALDRQISAFKKATAGATDIAGIDRLPDGAAYYDWALKLGTTTNHSPREIHAIGLEQTRMLQARIDTLLKGRGMTQGTVSERMQALANDPQHFYADDDQGRDQLIAYCNERVAALRALMPRVSHLGLKAPLVIKRVPVDIEAGAPLGYMVSASLDSSRPAIYYINLKSTKNWPKQALSTLTAHEGIPGHAWQSAYLAEHQKEMPLIASLVYFTAFVEGWALYSEQMADEFGLYDTDPLSKIGYLQDQQLRASRLVVDTGLHAMKWTREQSIRYLVETTGGTVEAMTSETDRYVSMPGQACGYKMGQIEILNQRARARTALGRKFDLAAFNDVIVGTGGVPLAVLPAAIDQYIAGAPSHLTDISG